MKLRKQHHLIYIIHERDSALDTIYWCLSRSWSLLWRQIVKPGIDLISAWMSIFYYLKKKPIYPAKHEIWLKIEPIGFEQEFCRQGTFFLLRRVMDFVCNNYTNVNKDSIYISENMLFLSQ